MVFLTFFRHIGCFPVKLIPGKRLYRVQTHGVFHSAAGPTALCQSVPCRDPRFIILTVEIHLIGWLEYRPVSPVAMLFSSQTRLLFRHY